MHLLHALRLRVPHSARKVSPVMLSAVGLALKTVCSGRKRSAGCSVEKGFRPVSFWAQARGNEMIFAGKSF